MLFDDESQNSRNDVFIDYVWSMMAMSSSSSIKKSSKKVSDNFFDNDASKSS